MPQFRQISFTLLELKGLWLRATGNGQMPPEMERVPELAQAADSATDKVYRAERNMPRKGHAPPYHPARGPGIDVRRQKFAHD